MCVEEVKAAGTLYHRGINCTEA